MFDVGQSISESISTSGRDLERGLRELSGSTIVAGVMMREGMIAAGAMISSALAGVGAALYYRDRMDQIRHTERLEFEELSSDAGRARRELKVATTLVCVGDAAQAADHLKESIRLFPTSAETFRVRSIVESVQGDHAAAALSLKTALRLADDDEFLPHFNNINDTLSESTQDAISVSIVTQLAYELSLLAREPEALELLDRKLIDRPSSVDLHHVRLRILSKTAEWDARHDLCIREIVELSPVHFNILHLDNQLGDRLAATRVVLKRLRSDAEIALKNKSRALIAVSKGHADLSLLNLPTEGKGSYCDLRRATNEMTMKILEYQRPRLQWRK